VPPTTSPAEDWSLHLIGTDVADVGGSARFGIQIELDERPEGHVVGRLIFSTDLFGARDGIRRPRTGCGCYKPWQPRPTCRSLNMTWSQKRSASIN